MLETQSQDWGEVVDKVLMKDYGTDVVFHKVRMYYNVAHARAPCRSLPVLRAHDIVLSLHRYFVRVHTF